MSLRKSAIIEKAQKLASKGQFAQAIREWNKLTSVSPNDGNIYNSIGDLHLKGGQRRQAADFFIKAAEAFQVAGFELKSIAVFKKALKLDTSRIEITEKLAEVYVDRGLIGNAIDDYLKAARSYLGIGNFERSLSIYRKASDLDPSNTDILLKIADMCREEGLRDEAIEAYKKLLTSFENKGEDSEAEKILKKIVDLDPSYKIEGTMPSVEPETARTHGEEDEPEIIYSDFDNEETHDSKPIENDPSVLFEPESELMTEEYTHYASEASLKAGDTQEESDGEKSLETYLREAEVYIQYELIDQAMAQLHSAIQQFPMDPLPHLKLKEIYDQQGNPEKQIETLKVMKDLYQQLGDEPGQQAVVDELLTLQPEEQQISENMHPPEKEYEREEAVFDVLSHDMAFDDGPTMDSLPSESSQAFNQGTEEEKEPQTFKEPGDFEGLTPEKEPMRTIDNLPELEQDPMGSQTQALDVTLTPDDIETAEDNGMAVHIIGETPEIHPVVKPFSDTGAHVQEGPTRERSAEAKKDYVDFQAYFSDELEVEHKNEEAGLEMTNPAIQDPDQKAQASEGLESEYDLGIAYREMGMLPEAIKAFEHAAQGKARFIDAVIMLSTCYRERGAIEKAFVSLERGLRRSALDQSATMTLQYELALLHDEEGNQREAADLYNAVFELDPCYREVAKKLGQVNRESAEPASPTPNKTYPLKQPQSTKKKDRVSYL